MNFQPASTLTDVELEQFREKTTRVSRDKWRALRAERKAPTVIRLIGGPLEGVPSVLQSGEKRQRAHRLVQADATRARARELSTRRGRGVAVRRGRLTSEDSDLPDRARDVTGLEREDVEAHPS